jgi:lysophospholipase L1-like esterase
MGASVPTMALTIERVAVKKWFAVAVTGMALAATSVLAASHAKLSGWTTSWASAQQIPDAKNAIPLDQLRDATLRQIVHLSRGGSAIRVRLSNVFGTTPLRIDAAHVAPAVAPGRAAIVASSDRPLAFAGKSGVTIPAGAEILSDPVAIRTAPAADLAISIHLPVAPSVETSHSASRATSFIARGNHVADSDLPGALAVTHWFHLSGIEVAGDGPVVVAVGDSITDGYGSGDDKNARWPDALAARLRADRALAGWGVVNAGISGNRVLADGIGPSLIDRFDRDVLGQRGVRVAILIEGVNDLGVMTRDAPQPPEVHRAMVKAIEDAFVEMARKARLRNVRLVGATITPFVGSDYYHPGPETEADRQAINAFIRTSGTFDAVIDFDAALRDPARPDRLLAAYDSGDHLHPSVNGYRRMAETVPLALFAPRPPAKRPAIALTFDDLPAHGPLPPGTDRLVVADTIIAALTRHRAPAFGFVNGGFETGNPQSPTVLAHWRAAGLPLGNHTFNHLNLSQNSATEFEAQTEKNERVIAPLMAGQDWHWLRYPFLSEGDTPAKRDAVRNWLADRGYKAAAVTMSFGDYAWNDVYARCAAKRDLRSIEMLERSYLDGARTEAIRDTALSRAVFKRDVPLVLLLHLGAFDARMIDRLLDQYAAMGYRFVSLAEAERDPFYKGATDLRLAGPTPTLEAAAAARQIAVPVSAVTMPGTDICS